MANYSRLRPASDGQAKLIIYTDGGARGNPGPAGIGIVFYDERNHLIKQAKQYIGEKTNNEAEYEALIKALQLANELGAKELQINLDSELVVRQLNGLYKIKTPHIQKLYIKVQKLAAGFNKVKYHHIPREKNKLADKLVNEAIDGAA